MGITILVAEDSQTQRHMIADMLKKKQYSVVTANNGKDALEKISQVSPDLIITDVIMPEMNGYEVLRRLRSNPKTQQIPVIFCSSKATQVDIYWGLKQGADAYISKPFQVQELLDTIKKLTQVNNYVNQ
ncbi:MAG: response regulator [Halothece sp.]